MAVVVPAHDEEQLLPACLDALREASRRAPLPVDVLVVLDSCADGSARIAAEAGVRTMEVQARNAGQARAAGAAAMLADDGGNTWLACTDADSRVSQDWLVEQLRLAEAGADVVTGVVDVDDWSEWPPSTVSAYRDAYRRGIRGEQHAHVHGANLGLTGDAYRRAGGFRPVAVGEDQALVLAAADAGLRVVGSTRVRVLTSARRDARAADGFSGYLHAL
ncbi:glycosyltransferase family 2 protein [Cryptosporangium phraense]|uniref:4,4'-diaponeurosporenoate glycosyltransferase n=1 Tax=Cryptosporangium phraense TaxID=2593070 RepID=A0A545AM01_9ACTN|nr:glycosyltransferase family 2 protein [Cryptosporangium phraense]